MQFFAVVLSRYVPRVSSEYLWDGSACPSRNWHRVYFTFHKRISPEIETLIFRRAPFSISRNMMSGLSFGDGSVSIHFLYYYYYYYYYYYLLYRRCPSRAPRTVNRPV